MSWHGVLGHDAVFEWFRRAVAHGRLASTFLFVGLPGVGKRLTALKLAQALSCETYPETRLEACGRCSSCAQVAAGTHPDLELVAKPEDKSFIPVETFIGDREHRLREGLCHTISLKPSLGRRRIAIIDDADYLNEAGANCLLKTLEEPPPRSVLILIGTSQQKQLPTIRSRCQIVRFSPLPPDLIVQLLAAQMPGIAPDEAQRLAVLSNGSLERAKELADQEQQEFHERLLSDLELASFDVVPLAKETNEYVEAAGKEAPPRRARARLLIGVALDFYRQLMRQLAGQVPAGDERLLRAVRTVAERWPTGAEGAAACSERCLEALLQIDQNAHVTTLIDCWLDDLSELAAGRLVRNVAAW